MLRLVGNIERFSTARHNLGIYRCVANTARYSTTHDSGELSLAIETALVKVIVEHAALCCGIINEDKNDPAYVRLDSIDVSKCIDYRTLKTLSAEEHEQELTRILEQRHSELWPDPSTLPPWKVIIVQSDALSSQASAFDAIFAFHHALGDGLSGVVFHRSFLHALNSSEGDKSTSRILKVPEPISLPPAMEKTIDFKICWYFLLVQLWKEIRPRWLFPDPAPPWAALPCSAANIQNYKSRVRIMTIEPELVPKILVASREQKATITGLLHGLIVTSLTTHVPEATSFASGTPFSLRHLTGLSPTKEMGVQVSAHISTYTPEIISRIRSSRTPEQVTSEIWNIARNFRAAMAAELAALPNDNLVGLIPYISGMHQYFQSKIGKPRAETYELSNVGNMNNKEVEGKWNIERDFFTQSGMATGSPVSFNVASVSGGPLCVTVTWLQGDIEEELVDKLAEDVKFGLKCIAEGKEVSLGLS
ncbi:putative alcohol acetyltransferase [Lachnellula subtilissima]|uniref:Putative alcohol acetyltransferase n=1 Tax=Lachnellula subtilissima TaxID=602034 RepID=A0A8H8RP88_9HELO|nr:putative alcohol acetyltransferase [Lachnellula subtilissima]